MYLSKISPNRVLMSLVVPVLVLGGAVAQANDIVVCKQSDPTLPVPAGSSYSFTLDGTRTFSLTVGGACMSFPNVGAGNHIITEAAKPGTVVSQISVDPNGRLVSLDLILGTVTVLAVEATAPTKVTFYNKQQPGTQGCTPGFWKQEFHFGLWVGYAPTQTVGSVFTGVLSSSLSNETLLDALQGGGGSGLSGAERILLRAAVAALLNSTNGSVSYPFTTTVIVNSVNAALATGDRDAILALATILDNANNGVGGCPLSRG
jgi:hypothetical protein